MSEKIKTNILELLTELPEGVMLVTVAKSRSPEEIIQAVEAGVKIIGENYIQEAERVHAIVGNRVKWHFIGHLQKNKVKRAVVCFDMIETVDSVEIAREIENRCRQINKVMPVLVEVNSGRETQKSGVPPEDVEKVIREIAALANIKVEGLMTVGPLFDQAEQSRPSFAATRQLFERIKKLRIQNVDMRYLSMGMTGNYHIAIEEGANVVRIGTRIFGERVK